MQICVHFYLIFRRKGTGEEQGVLQSKCLLLGYVMGSVTSNEPPRYLQGIPRYLQGITNDSSLARRIKRDVGIAFRRNKRKKNALAKVAILAISPKLSISPCNFYTTGIRCRGKEENAGLKFRERNEEFCCRK